MKRIFSIKYFFPIIILAVFSIQSSFAQIRPMVVDCPVSSISPMELSAGPGAGIVYPIVNVSTLNNCTNYTVSENYTWLSYTKTGLTVRITLQANTGPARTASVSIGNKTLMVYQACGNVPGSAGSITGPTNVCPGQTGVTYSVPPITNATGYQWTVPSGATIVSGYNTNSITVNYSASASSGDMSVYGTSSCGTGYPSTPRFFVSVRSISQPGSISGPTNVCPGTSYTYSVSPVSGASYYVWTLPSGASGSSSTNSINASFTASGTVSVYAVNSYGCTSASSSLYVNYSTLTSFNVSGSASVCPGNSTSVYLSGSESGITYNLYRNGTLYTSQTGTGSLLTFSNISQDGTYTVRGISAAGCDIPMSGNATISVIAQSTQASSISASPGPTVCPNASVQLSVVGGSLEPGTASWKWYTSSCGGSYINTGSVITVNPSTTTTYYVRAEGGCVTTACTSITINVIPPPSISQQPSGVTVCDGTSAGFSVTAAGAVSYQWQNYISGSWTNISGAANASYSFTASLGMNGIAYRCVVTGQCGLTTTSNSAILNISTLNLYSLSGGGNICPGTSTSVALSGSQSGITYNLYRNGTLYTSLTGTGSVLTFSNLSSAGTYTIKGITSLGCEVQMTGSATITVIAQSTAPSSVSSAPGTTVCPGTTVQLTVIGGSLEPGVASWKWYSGSCGSTLIGEGSSISIVPSTTTTYYVRAEGGCVTTSCASVSITVLSLPSIVSQPVNATVVLNTNASFTVNATGPNLQYQWQTSAISDGAWTDLTGLPATGYNTATLTIPGSSSFNNDYYRCRIISSCQTIYTNVVKLTTEFSSAEYLTGENIPDPYNRTLNTSYEIGTLPGSVSVTDLGASIYEIPVTVAPGTAGMEPQISIVYNSQLKDGVLGTGWNIAGLSSIQRVPQDFYHDNQRIGVSLQATDRFALDSNRLVLTEGIYGADNSVYRTELETFSRIKARGTAGTGPAWFTVETKDGRTLEYGNTTTSRVEAFGSSTVYLWRINKITDQSGNYIEFTYFENDGESYIESIKYTGNATASLTPYNKLVFDYSTRADQNFTYVAGRKIPHKVLLKSIKVLTENDALVREYAFKYVNDFHSHLSEIILYGKNNARINSTAIGWGSTTAPFTQGDYFNNNNRINNFTFGDFNGDGITDFVLTEKKASYTGTDKWQLWLSNDDGITFSNSGEGFLNSYFKDFFVVDPDGNGKDDIYWKSALSSITSFYYYVYSNQTGLSKGDTSFDIVINTADQGYSLVPADFDGNGKSDFLILNSSNSLYQVLVGGINRGGMSFTSPTDVKIIDFDGDGRKEVLVIQGGTSNIYQYNEGSQIFSSIFSSSSIPGNNRTFPGDFNGDKKTDLLYWSGGSGWSLNYSTGQGFISSGSCPALINIDPNLSLSDNNYFIADYNGDGKDDILEVYLNGPGSTLNVFYSKGGGSFTPESYNYPKTNINQSYFNNGDFNGDGKRDVFYYDYSLASNKGNLCFFPVNETRDKVIVFANGFNHRTKITYKRLNEGAPFYNMNGNAIFPLTDYAGPYYAVSKIESDNGLGTFSDYNYFWEGAKMHKQGRGFIGFETNTMVDGPQTTTTIKTFDFDLQRYFAFPKKVVNLNDNILYDTIYVSEMSYSVKSTGGISFYPYVSQSVNSDRLNKNTITTYYDFDDYGNTTRLRKVYHNDEQGFGQEAVMSTTSQYSSYGNWGIPNKILSVTDSSQYTGEAVYVRAQSFTYNSQGIMLTGISDPGKSKALTTTYSGFNSFGLPVTKTISASGVTSRSNTFEYDPKGRFVTGITDALGMFSSKTYDPGTGNVLTETTIDNLTTTYVYDNFGTLTETVTPLSKHIFTTKSWQTAYRYSVTTDAEDQPYKKVYYDLLGRELKSEAETPAGLVYQLTKYNDEGQVEYKTWPETEILDENDLRKNFLRYDDYGRLVKDSINGTYTRYVYSGKTSTALKWLGSDNFYGTSSKKNSLGNIIESTEDNATVSKTYYSNGQVKQISAEGTIVSFSYDEYGRQTSMNNPNNGTINYEYNAFGELTKQTDAKGDSITFVYDNLGRVSSKTSKEGTSTYVYKTTGNGKGQLESVTSPESVSVTYTYDSYGRVTQQTETIPGDRSLSTSFGYDTWGNNTSMTYPSGISITNVFTNGYLNEIKKSDGTSIWKLDSLSALGQPRKYSLGASQNMKTRFTYDSYGYLTEKTLANQILELESDTLSGNLMSRGISTGFHLNRESFTYDAMNRLDSSFVNMNNHQKFTYDDSGNILTKTGVGNYIYNSQKINRLDSIADPGPLMPTSTQDFTYNSNNLTTSVLDSLSMYKLDLLYGPGNQRIRTILTQEGDTIKTKYFTTAFEKEITASGERDLNYIYSPYGLIAVLIKQGTNENLYYSFTDHLGSIISLLNPDGTLAERYSYDAWGRRRNPITWTYDSIPTPTIIDRGFTGHEHLDGFGLINMNGRMYDPALGRFLSVDPFIQFPESAQSYNGYGYVVNNPLKFSDPTGMLREALPNPADQGYSYNYEGAAWLADYYSRWFGGGGGGGGFSRGHYGTMGSGYYDVGYHSMDDLMGSLWNATTNNTIGTFTNVNGSWYKTSTSIISLPYDFDTNRSGSILNMSFLPSAKISPLYNNSELAFTGVLKNYQSPCGQYVNGVVQWIDNYSDGSSVIKYSWKAVMGPWGSGPILLGNFTLKSSLMGLCTGVPGYLRDGVDFYFKISGHYDIHADQEPAFGTSGCIGLQESASGLMFFYFKTSTYLLRHRTMNLSISY